VPKFDVLLFVTLSQF